MGNKKKKVYPKFTEKQKIQKLLTKFIINNIFFLFFLNDNIYEKMFIYYLFIFFSNETKKIESGIKLYSLTLEFLLSLGML